MSSAFRSNHRILTILVVEISDKVVRILCFDNLKKNILKLQFVNDLNFKVAISKLFYFKTSIYIFMALVILLYKVLP